MSIDSVPKKRDVENILGEIREQVEDFHHDVRVTHDMHGSVSRFLDRLSGALEEMEGTVDDIKTAVIEADDVLEAVDHIIDCTPDVLLRRRIEIFLQHCQRYGIGTCDVRGEASAIARTVTATIHHKK